MVKAHRHMTNPGKLYSPQSRQVHKYLVKLKKAENKYGFIYSS